VFPEFNRSYSDTVVNAESHFFSSTLPSSCHQYGKHFDFEHPSLILFLQNALIPTKCTSQQPTKQHLGSPSAAALLPSPPTYAAARKLRIGVWSRRAVQDLLV
jgi:hypothetical protein